MRQPIILGVKINIRPLRLADAKSIYKNVNDPLVTKWTLHLSYPYPKDGAAKFIRKSYQDATRGRTYLFGICEKDSDDLIGLVSLMNIDPSTKSGEVGYWLGRKYWGKGYTSEACKLIINFGFKNLKLHRIYAKLFSPNIASKRVLEKAGMKPEGVLRDARHRYGKYHDELRYGILCSEYDKG